MKKIVLLVLLALLITGCSVPGIPGTEQGQNPSQSNDKAPIMAPGFALKDMDGKTWSLEGLAGNVVVLYFWTATCPNCLDKLPELAELQRDLPKDVILLLINGGDSKKSIENAMADYSGLTVLMDAIDANGNNTFGLYAVRYVPTIAFIDKEGNFAQGFIGPISNGDIRQIVEELR